MTIFLMLLAATVVVAVLLKLVNWISYRFFTRRVLRRQKWDLNICAGKTDGGGVNIDIVKHADLPNLVIVEDVENLPYEAGHFESCLCSHTLEHVDDPDAFLAELRRVSQDVTILLPPLWDLGATFNLFEHKWIFLSWKVEHHNKLPRRIRMPFTEPLHQRYGQKVRA